MYHGSLNDARKSFGRRCNACTIHNTCVHTFCNRITSDVEAEKVFGCSLDASLPLRYTVTLLMLASFWSTRGGGDEGKTEVARISALNKLVLVRKQKLSDVF